MPSARVFIQTSLLISLCAAYPAQGQSQNEAKNAGSAASKSYSTLSSSKKRIAVVGLPAVTAKTITPQLRPRANSNDIASASKKAASKSYPSNSLERGFYLKQQGQLNAALLEFIKSAHENPREVRAFYEQAQIFKQQGNTKLAKSALEQALAIAPKYTEARTMLVQTHLESGNLIGVANEVGKLFNLGQERPKREAPSYLAYQGAPSAAIQIAKGNFPKASSGSTQANAVATSPEHSNITATTQNTEDKSTPESASKPDETSIWLNSAIKNNAQPEQQAETPVATESDTRIQSTQSTNTEKSTSDILASLGVKTSASATPNSSATAQSSAATTSAPTQTVSTDTGIFGRMKARTGQAISSVQRISKSNIESVKKISHVPHMPVPHVAVPHVAVPQWVKDVRSHIPFMPPAQEEQAETATAETPKEGLKEQAANLMSWVKDRIPIQTKEKENRQLAEKMKAAMGTANKNSSLPPEVAKAIEAKLGIHKTPEQTTANPKAKDGEKAPLYSPEMQKAIEAKLAQVRAADPTAKAADTGSAKTDPAKADAESSKINAQVDEQKQKNNDQKLQLVELLPQEAGQHTFSSAEENKNSDKDKQSQSQDISSVFADTVLECTRDSLASASPTPSSETGATAEKSEVDSVKQVLASLGVKSDAQEEAASNLTDPRSSKPAYGLLGNTALKHISTLPIPSSQPRPSFIDSIWKQAGSTFAHLIPKIDWKLPTIDTSALLSSKQAPSPELIAASTDAAAEVRKATPEIHQQLTELSNSSAPPTPVPLDISRILSKLGPAPQPIAMNSAVAPPLSATIPIAAPVNINQYIPVPKPQEAPVQNLASLPQMTPQGLSPSKPSGQGPKSAPASAQTAGNMVLPPVMQQVWDQAQPLLQPAMKAANTIAQTFAPDPLSIPKQDSSLTAPVDMKSSAIAMNNAPTPIGADMKQYFENQMVPTMPPQTVSGPEAEQLNAGLTKTGGREIVSSARAKNGAFTFMKPVMDSDSSFLLGANQVRTIAAPIPTKTPPKPAPPPEDAITKRMRYLMENGTSNLRQGEAFMFSEETGEGILFLPGRTERRKLTAGRDAEQLLRERRPDIAQPKDLQYSLNLLGKLMGNQQAQQQQQQQQPAINGPSLDQLMNQVNEGQRSVWGWMKNTFKM